MRKSLIKKYTTIRKIPLVTYLAKAVCVHKCTFFRSMVASYIVPGSFTTPDNKKWLRGQVNKLCKQYTQLYFTGVKCYDRTLEVLLMLNEEEQKKSQGEQKWLFFCGGNNENFFETLPLLNALRESLSVNIVTFNYCQVGLSSGLLKDASCLITDAICVFEWLQQKYQVEPCHTLIYGRSLGGGVGTILRSLYPQGPLVNERSFSALSTVIQAVGGYMTNSIAQCFNWELDSFAALKNIQNYLVIFHKEDTVVPYCSSLARICSKDHIVELKSRWFRVYDYQEKCLRMVKKQELEKQPHIYKAFFSEEPHNQDLWLDKEEWQQCISHIKNMWCLNSSY